MRVFGPVLHSEDVIDERAFGELSLGLCLAWPTPLGAPLTVGRLASVHPEEEPKTHPSEALPSGASSNWRPELPVLPGTVRQPPQPRRPR
jgi:hypothetical protein